MNSYRTTNGERLTKSKIDRNIRKAKEAKKRAFKNQYGYIFCETCSTTKGFIDNSHIISVKYAQETGRTELAWSQKNIIYQCRICHLTLENLGNQERENIYKSRL